MTGDADGHIVAGADASPAPIDRYFLAAIIVLTFVMNTVGRGVTETFAVFLLPVQKGLDVTRSEITATYSIFSLAFGLSAPFAGQLIDRFGARLTYGIGLFMLGTGYIAAGSAGSIWQYYAAVGLAGGLGASCLGMVVASSLLSRWFTRRIGSVAALPYAAVGAGMLTVPPLAQLLIESFGWRSAHELLGLAVLGFVVVVLALPLGRMSAGSAEWQRMRRGPHASGSGPWPLSAAVRTGAFWGLFSAYFFTAIAAYSVLPQSVAYLIEVGFDPLFAAQAFGFTGMLSVFGIIGIGWLSDRIGRRPAATISYVSSMIGMASLLLIVVFPSVLLVAGFVLFFGLMQGARGPILVALVAVLFRGGAVGSIFGLLSVALGAGAAVGAWTSGYLHDLTGGYVASFALGMLGSAMGLLLFWTLPSLSRESPLPEPES